MNQRLLLGTSALLVKSTFVQLYRLALDTIPVCSNAISVPGRRNGQTPTLIGTIDVGCVGPASILTKVNEFTY